jgi:rhodanese-related sulfurtransferase
MNNKKLQTRWLLWLCAVLTLTVAATADVGTAATTLQQPAPSTDFITAAELKTKIARNERLTIVDVRATSGLLNDDNKIRGAIYVKLRRLKSRLAFPPLRDVPRDQEIVIYCACPNDESAIRGAQLLTAAGFRRTRVLKGGWTAWKKSNGQVEPLAIGI